MVGGHDHRPRTHRNRDARVLDDARRCDCRGFPLLAIFVVAKFPPSSSSTNRPVNRWTIDGERLVHRAIGAEAAAILEMVLIIQRLVLIPDAAIAGVSFVENAHHLNNTSCISNKREPSPI